MSHEVLACILCRSIVIIILSYTAGLPATVPDEYYALGYEQLLVEARD